MFFSDNAILNFINDKMPEYYELFVNLKYKIQQIDLFRYLAIYYYGGLYLDTDVELYKPVDGLDLTKCYIPIEYGVINTGIHAFLLKQGCEKTIGNYAFYAPKNSHFIKMVISNIINNRIDSATIEESRSQYCDVILKPNFLSEKEYLNIYFTTGPILFTQTYIDFISAHTENNNIDDCHVQLLKPSIETDNFRF
jgi:mannosyltransferase OCH1-like enzyme